MSGLFADWWSRAESNRRPSHCERDALPTELRPQILCPHPCERAAYDSRLMPVANPLFSAKPQSPPRADFAIWVFAKTPIVGQCKTRLARQLGNVRATRLYRAMLEHAVARACALAPGRVTLACSPSPRHPMFVRLAARYGVTRRRQANGPLGYRMAQGVRQALQMSDRVILMGTDQPELEGSWLDQALAQLRHGHSAWLAPTHDGGYWAIGLCRANARVFRGPAWSTSRVARTTRTRALALGLDLERLPARRDIDEGRDWHQLSRGLRAPLARAASMPGLGAPGPSYDPGE